MSDVPVSPTRRRHWWVGLLLLGIAVGGAVWWRYRLTPDERLLVGHWRCLSQMPDGTIDESTIEFRSDRTLLGSGTTVHWAARNGQIYLQLPADPIFLSAVLQWIQNGFKDWPVPEKLHGRVEIMGHDAVSIKMQRDGADYEGSEFIRIVEK